MNGGTIQQGKIDGLAILQGNFHNTANGNLKIKICNNNVCSEGEKPVSQSIDNSFFTIPLNKPLEINKGPVDIYIEQINSTKPLALWLWPMLNEFPETIEYNNKIMQNKAVKLSFLYEKPKKITIPSNTTDAFLQITGWAVDSIAKNTASGIVVVIDNKLFYPGEYGIIRPDVSTALNNPNYKYSGFNVNIPSYVYDKLSPGKHILQLRIINHKETGYYETDPIEMYIEK